MKSEQDLLCETDKGVDFDQGKMMRDICQTTNTGIIRKPNSNR